MNRSIRPSRAVFIPPQTTGGAGLYVAEHGDAPDQIYLLPLAILGQEAVPAGFGGFGLTRKAATLVRDALTRWIDGDVLPEDPLLVERTRVEFALRRAGGLPEIEHVFDEEEDSRGD